MSGQPAPAAVPQGNSTWDFALAPTQLIQQMGIMLALPQVGIAAALVSFHTFYHRTAKNKFDAIDIATACLFLATKVEECPRRIRDLLNVRNHLQQKNKGVPLHEIQPIDIHSQRYGEMRQRLVRSEREILKELGFILYSDHPHKYILNYVRLLTTDTATGAALAQYAWNFLNDSQRTDVCIHFRPEVICCSALEVAARVHRVKLPSRWWEVFEASRDEMDAVVTKVTSLYSMPPVEDFSPDAAVAS